MCVGGGGGLKVNFNLSVKTPAHPNRWFQKTFRQPLPLVYIEKKLISSKVDVFEDVENYYLLINNILKELFLTK